MYGGSIDETGILGFTSSQSYVIPFGPSPVGYLYVPPPEVDKYGVGFFGT
jgi:hypothetical protein